MVSERVCGDGDRMTEKKLTLLSKEKVFSAFQQLSLSKLARLTANLSCENEFYLHKNEKSFHINGFAFSLSLKERLGNDQVDGCRFWIVLGRLKSVWRLLVISQWIQPQNKDINCYFQRICLPLGEEVCYEREDKRRPKSLTKNILTVWRQDAVSLCDTGRTWHCLSELMVADDSQEYTKQRVLEMTVTAWTVIALSFLAGPHYVLYTVQMRILMWTRQNIKQYHCDYFFKKITFIWLQHFLWQYLHLHGGKIKTTYKRERKNTMLRHFQLIKPLWLLAGPEPLFWKLKHEHDIRFLMTVDFEVLSSMIADNDNSFDIEGRVKDFESVPIVYGIIKVQILFTFVSSLITLSSPPLSQRFPLGIPIQKCINYKKW